jgi:hypothetical protein
MKYEPEFYVGYLPVPAGLKRRLRWVIGFLVSAGALIAVLLVGAQGPFAPATFEFGKTSDVEGTLIERPYPAIAIPGEATPWLLAGPGKHGLARQMRGLDGHEVRLTGSRIFRGKDRMLEVEAVRDLGSGDKGRRALFLDSVSLRGEIVDTKCFFGVMNPGNGKVHRDCAARCIAGGIAPGFLVRDGAGRYRTLLLANADGGPLHTEVLDYVAEPVTIRGSLFDESGRLVLRTDPRQLRRSSE